MADSIIRTVVLSSLHKVFHDDCPTDCGINEFVALKNEPFSFQVAYKLESEKRQKIPFYLKVETDLPISGYTVGNVPVMHAERVQDDAKRGPGLYPDMLIPKKTDAEISRERDAWCSWDFESGERNQLMAYDDSWQAFWFTINECGEELSAGSYSIKIKTLTRGSQILSEDTVKLELVDALLPKQEIIITNWFHCDCLADTYNIEVFSDRFFEIFEDYARKAAINGMNMILLPAFTPPLDTPIGKERMTVQLVGVECNNGEYKFDFSLMKKFIDISRRAGIEYFEHNHLFTQWGSTSAPKVMAKVDGVQRRIFGWDVSSTDKSYINFLRQYVIAADKFFVAENLVDKILFHISDEPSVDNCEAYVKAKETLGDLIDKYMCGDALSDYVFYEKGYTKIPIVGIGAIPKFFGKCDSFWGYYTGSSRGKKMTNRLIINSNENNRILGVLLYYFNMKGFLHWGYNYYYDMLSQGVYDPKIKTDGYYGRPGASYLVYPDSDGTAIQSMRQKVFFEGINDLRALLCLESLIGRESVLEIINSHFGEITIEYLPESLEQLLNFRKDINEKIAKAVKQ